MLSTANAADVYARGESLKDAPPAAVDYRPAIGWSGFYLGMNAGAAFDDSDIEIAGGEDAIFVAGMHVGYNWQRGDGLVVGVEGDVDFADDVDYIASVRGRLGFGSGP